MTPIASKMPEWMRMLPRNWPRDSGGTRKDCVIIVTMIMTIETRARPLALASYEKLAEVVLGRGEDMPLQCPGTGRVDMRRLE